MYKFRESANKNAKNSVNLFGSGTILNKVIEAQKLLQEKYDIAADIWSITSYKELHYNAIMTERWNMFHPDKKAQLPYVSQQLKGSTGVFVAASDYVKALPESIARWIPGRLVSLGTDGFGRSDGRRHLRDFFEVDARYITLAALYGLFQEGKLKVADLKKALKDLEIDPEKANPMIS